MAAWVVRGGSAGEYEASNLADGVATIAWAKISDLGMCCSREDVRALVDAAFPADHPQRRAVNTGQLWAFGHLIVPGDLVLMPMKTHPGYVALGRCAGPYRLVTDSGSGERAHQVPVAWRDDPVAKTAIKDDLLNTLNSIMTVFQPSRNNAAVRLERMFETGIDPGSGAITDPHPGPAHVAPPPTAASTQDSQPDADLTDPETVPTLAAVRDRIRTHLVENFAGHKLTGLIAEILTARGFVCDVSPPGPDGGVDIVAGRGPLGLDDPTVIVEVKSEPTSVGSSVLRGLHSAMTQYRASQGLLVAWGGTTKQARNEFSTQRTQIRVWGSEDVLDQLFATYETLSAATKTAIPLKQALVLDEIED